MPLQLHAHSISVMYTQFRVSHKSASKACRLTDLGSCHLCLQGLETGSDNDVMVITCRDVSVSISIQTRLGYFSPNSEKYGSLATQDYKTNTLGYTYHMEGNSDAGKSWRIW